jgi:NAD(P)-dependent dehydrogenase (short-subunit alcohol dehydrogenase family)
MFFSRDQFNAASDIPSLAGKVILVTGGNAGLGKQSALDFARHGPAEIWVAARSVDKAQAAINEVRSQVPDAPTLKPLELDLASFDSVKKAADTFLAASPRLDILLLNAGIMATPAGVTREGYEVQWGTNHMGHALLARLLLPALQSTAKSSSPGDVRVVAVSSYGHTSVPTGGFRFDTLKNEAEALGAYGRYYQSKLGNVLWARQMARLHPELTVASVHPGLVQTQLMDGATATPFLVKMLARMGHGLLATVDKGARNQLWACVSKDVVSGEYYEPVGVGGKASANGTDDHLAKAVWDWTEGELSAWLEGKGREQ